VIKFFWNEPKKIGINNFQSVGDPFEDAILAGEKIKEEKNRFCQKFADDFIANEMPKLIIELFANFSGIVDFYPFDCEEKIVEKAFEIIIFEHIINYFKDHPKFFVKHERIAIHHFKKTISIHAFPMGMTIDGLRICIK